MRVLATLAAAAFSAFLAASAFAQDAEGVKATLKKKFPEAPIDAVRKIPYGNLYEVQSSGELFYTDDKVTYLLLGSLVDAKSKENVTEARQRVINAVKFEELPLDSAVKIVRGNGTQKVAIFEDPNCGYCKRFERDLQSVSDITVYVFLYPILSPDSMTKSKAVWCAPDKGQAWLDIMLKNTGGSDDAKCATPIDKVLAFGKAKRIQGTPTIIFEDGERVPGAMTIAAFEKKLQSLKPQPTAAAK